MCWFNICDVADRSAWKSCIMCVCAYISIFVHIVLQKMRVCMRFICQEPHACNFTGPAHLLKVLTVKGSNPMGHGWYSDCTALA